MNVFRLHGIVGSPENPKQVHGETAILRFGCPHSHCHHVRRAQAVQASAPSVLPAHNMHKQIAPTFLMKPTNSRQYDEAPFPALSPRDISPARDRLQAS